MRKVEETAEQIPILGAKLHAHGNTLTIHTSQLDAIIGPKDSLLLQMGGMSGRIGLVEERLKTMDGALDEIKALVGKLVKSNEIARANTSGQWQLRATVAAALIAALSAVAVAALQMF
jgi:hypothetical protein